MKAIIRNTIFTAAVVLMAASSAANAGDYEHKGNGGWRTSDGHGNPVLDDKGYNKYDTGLDYCKQICDSDSQCHGIEYRSSSSGWSENNQYVHDRCEIHHDPYYYCDPSASGEGHDNGCWVKKEKPVSHEPKTDYKAGECYSKHWNWISFANPGGSDVSPDPNDSYKLKNYPWSNTKFDVIRFQDCTISFRSHENYKYVSVWDSNHYYLQADGYYIGDEDRYKVYKYSDGTYGFKSVKYGKWVYTDYNGYLKADSNSNDENFRKYHVTENGS